MERHPDVEAINGVPVLSREALIVQNESRRAGTHRASGFLAPTKPVEVEHLADAARLNQCLVDVIRAALAISQVVKHCFIGDAHVHAWRLDVVTPVPGVVGARQDSDGCAIDLDCGSVHCLSFR